MNKLIGSLILYRIHTRVRIQFRFRFTNDTERENIHVFMS